MTTESFSPIETVSLPFNRGRTAIVQCRSHLRQAAAEIEVALNVMDLLQTDPVRGVASPPIPPGEAAQALHSLQVFLKRLTATQRALARSWGPLGPTPGGPVADGNS